MSTKYPFKDEMCRELFNAAAPVGNYCGFAWREDPKALEGHWVKATKGMPTEEKAELLKTCLLAGDAQRRYRAEQQKSGVKLHRPKGISPWFGSGAYYSEIGSHAELKEKKAAKLCHCGNEWPCERHYYDTVQDDWRWELINQKWKELGKPKTQTECIHALKDAGHLNVLLFLKRPEGKRGKNLTKMGDMWGRHE